MRIESVSRRAKSGAFTMVELLAVVAIIGVLVGLLLPAVQSSREAARRRSCSNNLMQIGLAVTAYHESFQQYPIQLSGTDGSATIGQDNDRRLSFLVGILPFLGQQALVDDIGTPQPLGTANTMMGLTWEDDMYWDDVSSGGMESSTMSGSESDTSESDTEPSDADGNRSETGASVVKEHLSPAGGPEPFNGDYQPWMFEVPTYRCPSDPGIGKPSFGRNNYAACMGDGMVAIDTGPMKSINGRFVWDEKLAAQTEASMRGIFVPRSRTRLSDIVDGASHTVLLAEIGTHLGDKDARTDAAIGPGELILRDHPNWADEHDLADPERPMFWRNGTKTITSTIATAGRGYRWADGMPLFTGVNTILPPNAKMVISASRDDTSGYFPASSRHQGGANVAFADTSIRFISDSIDTGDSDAPTPYVGSTSAGERSPYGIWGAMGTRASEELVLVGEQHGG